MEKEILIVLKNKQEMMEFFSPTTFKDSPKYIKILKSNGKLYYQKSNNKKLKKMGLRGMARKSVERKVRASVYQDLILSEKINMVLMLRKIKASKNKTDEGVIISKATFNRLKRMNII